MQPRTKAMRAVSSLYAQDVIVGARNAGLIGIAVLACGVIGLAVWLSAWWLIFLAPFAVLAIGVVVAARVATAVAVAVGPEMSDRQRRAAAKYIQSMRAANDVVHTPKFIIACKISIDIFKRRWQDGYIARSIRQSAALKGDFAELERLFG